MVTLSVSTNQWRVLPDGQRVVEEVGGLLVLVLVPVDQRQDVQHGRHVRMIVTRRLLEVL